MNKRVLMLSAVAAALFAGAALAAGPTTITTVLTAPINTATDGDITINSGGGVNVTTGNPAIKVNSNNSLTLLAGSTVSNLNTASASGIVVDLTAASYTGTITDAGTINLTGSTTARGLWLEGPASGSNSFTGAIDLTASTFKLSGDNSIGVLMDSTTILNGDLTDSGAMSLAATTPNSTTASGLIAMKLAGVINGNVTIGTGTGTAADTATNITVIGQGAQGIILTGTINACNTTAQPSCTSAGSFVNRGNITTTGTSTPSATATNPEGGTALGIGGSVAGGILNAGNITVQGNAPAVLISPYQTIAAGTPGPIVIGVYAGDTTDPGFSFYNTGTISAAPIDANLSSVALQIGSKPTDLSSASAGLTGGIFNAGQILATASSKTTGAAAVSATAVLIDNNGIVGLGDLTVKIAGEQAAFVNAHGTIAANINGVAGGIATAIFINTNGSLPSLINTGVISAIANTTDTTITGLTAFGIRDLSGTLTQITNNGTIQAIAGKTTTPSATTVSGTVTPLDDGSQLAIAIDLRNGVAPNVHIDDTATASGSANITGAIVFGSTGDDQELNVTGFSPLVTASVNGNIVFGNGAGLKLNVNHDATVTGAVTVGTGGLLAVNVASSGTLNLTNSATALNADTLDVQSGGTLGIDLSQALASGVVRAATEATIADGATLNTSFSSFLVGSGDYVLITAPDGMLTMSTFEFNRINSSFTNSVNTRYLLDPFSSKLCTFNVTGTTACSGSAADSELVAHLVLKTADQAGLSGYANQLYPFANAAIANDPALGAAMINDITSQLTAIKAYDQFAPDISGGIRAIAVSLTDQSSGPVAARQRELRLYSKTPGDLTLWGHEFAQEINDPNFKDRGFGFALGADSGDPRIGWYGGAFTFYSGDVVEPLPRTSRSNSLWYMLTAYTDWRGRGLFLDTKFDVGYMSIKGKRTLSLTNATSTFVEEADSKRAGLVGAAGVTTGVVLAYGATTITPQLSVDAMSMREEGFTESHSGNGNGMGFDLTTQPYYANSVRAFIGASVREDLKLGDFYLQPEARLGYRYDFLNNPVKLKTAFADVNASLAGNQAGTQFIVTGYDPSPDNVVAGASLSATTDSWTMGLNFDYVRGSSGQVQEVGTIHLLGRI